MLFDKVMTAFDCSTLLQETLKHQEKQSLQRLWKSLAREGQAAPQGSPRQLTIINNVFECLLSEKGHAGHPLTSSITTQICFTHWMMASGVPDMVTARSVELGSMSPATCTWAPVDFSRDRAKTLSLPCRQWHLSIHSLIQQRGYTPKFFVFSLLDMVEHVWKLLPWTWIWLFKPVCQHYHPREVSESNCDLNFSRSILTKDSCSAH